MQVQNGRFIYSATDLNNYLECGHLVSLQRRLALGELRRPERNATVALIAEKGLQHEQAFLERLRSQHADIVEIVQTDGSLAGIERAAAETVAAMERGAPVIYQGTFFDGTFLGKSDFLLRVETPSAHWPWSYEVVDTKLALHDKPYFIIQLCHYSEHVARVQGSCPQHMVVVLGNDTQKRFRVDDYAAYYRHLKASFLQDGAASDAYPLRCEHCAICDWSPLCEQKREADDHLSGVAWMRGDNVARFEAGGIGTIAQLAAATNGRPYGMQEKTYARLRRQAALQVRGRETGAPHYELLDHPPTEGFGLMPMPSQGDVFFDMEGDPYYEIGTGLEYLFGCYCPGEARPFVPFWGTDRAGEKRAFEQCVDFLIERRRAYPAMHAYHYASYEKTALRKLAQRHQTREDEVDELLRGEVLVDLFAVVRQSLMISQSSYSIKKLEPFYAMVRSADIRKGDDSVVMFETWLKEPADRAILEQIERYNEEDCRSTHLLREWLLERRGESAVRRGITLDFRPLTDPDALCHPTPLEGCKKCDKRVREEREEAKMSQAARALSARERDPAAVLLGQLLSYHRREEKPAWWSFFDRCENVDQLLEFDKESLAGLELQRDAAPFLAGPKDRNAVYTYWFPDQLHHLPDDPRDPRTRKAAGDIYDIDEDRNFIRIKRAGTLGEAQALKELVPGGPHVADAQKKSLARTAAAYLDGTLAARHPATLDILRNGFPRLTQVHAGARIQPASVSPEALYDIVSVLERSYLFVQGPPGSGKTYTGARVIARLLAAGKRVGVMAGGHKAIHNLLHELEKVAHEGRIPLHGLHKHSGTNRDSLYVSKLVAPLIASADDNVAAETRDYNLISGTGWLFAREGMVGRLDYLFIDEAGQTALADAVAVSTCAKNIVLLGDPMQLAQVTQGVHGEGAGASVLAHLLGDASTVPENRGVLLDTSYRMAPAICTFISNALYDGRLQPAACTANNRIGSPGLSGSGLRYVPVTHAGNGRESSEEAERIVDEIALLLRGTAMRSERLAQALDQGDIMVVTPYNAQHKLIAAMLERAGFPRVLVGTVDKFQGKEAPVVFYSMATSGGEDLPRNLEFLFNRNRFNVAVSRAQCMSVLVCSPRLLEVRCADAEQMALVNLLCEYVEEAKGC